MTLRWLWFNHVPPGIDLSTDQRRAVRARSKSLRSARRTSPRENVAWLASVLAAGVLALLIIMVLGMYFMPRAQRAGAEMLVVVAIPLLIGGVFWVVLAHVYNRTHAPHVRRALNELGFPVCERCGYVLRGLASDTSACPECGGARSADIGSRIGG